MKPFDFVFSQLQV